MSSVIGALVEALGDQVRVGDDIPLRNHADASLLTPTPPQALILPRSTSDVATALRICNERHQPVVVQGGLTGLAGGAHPQAGEIALSLERMMWRRGDRFGERHPDGAGRDATRSRPAGGRARPVFCAGSISGPAGTCTIGGNIATNAGGNQVLRYGMARRNTLGLEVVLADGTVVRSLNKMLKNNAGYDWTQLFIGSEGTLGVVTRVVIGLHPKPQGHRRRLCAR